MTPRRLGLCVSLAVAVLAGPRWLMAQGQINQYPAPVFQNEGRDPIAFNVLCATTPWTMAASSDTISRSTFLEATSSNTYAVCLVPGNTAPPASTRCSTGTVGVELPPNSSYTDYSRAAWWCAASSGTIAQPLKGVRTRDRGDYGNIAAPGKQ